jgi:hypothetical protein
MPSAFQYDSNNHVTNLVTLYGETKFQALSGTSTRHSGLRRGLLISEPTGDQQLYSYVDAGPSAICSIIDGPSFARNSYHWNRAQFAAISVTGRTNLLDMPDEDYLKASIKHFLHGTPVGAQQIVSDTLGAEAGPADQSGNRAVTSYVYQGQLGNQIGTRKAVERIWIPNNLAMEIARNDVGRPTNTTYYNRDKGGSLISATMFTNVYDSSGVYLQKVWGPKGELVRGYGYHPVITNLLTSVTNAAGDVIRYTHDTNNNAMRVITITMPGNLVRSNTYFASGTNAGFLQKRVDYLANGVLFAPTRSNM